MKTMQLDDKVVRVGEDKVKKKVSEGWKFVPKSLWKQKVRDVKKTKETPKNTPKTKKNNKMSKSAKRHLRKNNK